jgi:hypothetical protein
MNLRNKLSFLTIAMPVLGNTQQNCASKTPASILIKGNECTRLSAHYAMNLLSAKWQQSHICYGANYRNKIEALNG